MSEVVLKIITTYHLTENVKSGKFKTDHFYDEVLNNGEFCNLISGKNMKNLLFNEGLENKRFHTEEFYKLYALMGGTEKGISRQNLEKTIQSALKFYSDPGSFMLSEDEINFPKQIKEEIDEIFKFISTENSEYLSLKDFVNAMTSCKGFPVEDFSLFNL